MMNSYTTQKGRDEKEGLKFDPTFTLLHTEQAKTVR